MARSPRDKYHRRPIRLRGYDYALPGAYFVTICVQDRECLLGEIAAGQMVPSEAGSMVQSVWGEITNHYPGVGTDAFVLMPNYVHAIIVLSDSQMGAQGGASPMPDGRAGRPAATLSLADVVHRFKSLTTALYRRDVAQKGWTPFPKRLWQRNYYEHVIRNQGELEHVREYIANNPTKWDDDDDNPVNLTGAARRVPPD